MVEDGLLDNGGLLDLGRPIPAAPVEVPEGTCHVCGRPAGRVPCRACGRRACGADHWAMFGLCMACASERDMARWHRTGKPEDRNWLGDHA